MFNYIPSKMVVCLEDIVVMHADTYLTLLKMTAVFKTAWQTVKEELMVRRHVVHVVPL